MKFTTVGLQRSGTNFVNSFIKPQGFTYLSKSPTNLFYYNFFAWKHWHSPKKFAKDVDAEHIIVLVTKHPLKWIESILRNPADITYAYPYVQYGGLQISHKHRWRLETFHYLSIETLLQHYNTFYTNWLETNLFKNFYVVRYEDMIDLNFANQFVEDLCYDFNMPFTAIKENLQNIEMSPGIRTNDYLERYKKGQHSMSESVVNCAREKISSRLLTRLHYQL